MSSKPVVELQRRPRAKTGSGLRRDAEAALTDPSTNHLDTKSPTAMQTSKKITSGQRGTNAVVSRSICFDLKNIFAVSERELTSYLFQIPKAKKSLEEKDVTR